MHGVCGLFGDLTRTRSVLTRHRSHPIQRVQELLEDAGITLSSVATDMPGVLGRAMLEALISGHRDPGDIADLAHKRMRVNESRR